MRVFIILATLIGGPALADTPYEMGRALFMGGAQPGCGVCHTLADAGSVGEIGPNLNDLAPDEARVVSAVSGGVGVMPAYLALSENEVAALATYVAEAAAN